MIQDTISFEMYPFVNKEEFLRYKRLYEEQKEINDDLHNKLDLFDYALKEGKIKDTKLNEIARQNIIFEVKIKLQQKQMQNLNLEIGRLRHQIKRTQQEKDAEELRVKLSVQKWINISDDTKQKIKLQEQLTNEVTKLQNLKLSVIKEIKGFVPEGQKIKLLPSLQSRDERKINKLLKQAERKLKSSFFKEKNRNKAMELIFEVKQQISFMDTPQKELYSKEIERLENGF